MSQTAKPQLRMKPCQSCGRAFAYRGRFPGNCFECQVKRSISLRPCLCCERPFRSTGRFHRICDACHTYRGRAVKTRVKVHIPGRKH